ncbi:hypothetical protein OsJ_34949 [Oryza sativa Japonica Group]|uniref:Uncharacterized protein n=1 Tax=Oryza sativa subsp. japonica TaxID=39947 RepID=B9GBF9_ORYSJ|nr:hypothetical protein OsJ_34949 [Oryza sativa Japonica Group]
MVVTHYRWRLKRTISHYRWRPERRQNLKCYRFGQHTATPTHSLFTADTNVIKSGGITGVNAITTDEVGRQGGQSLHQDDVTNIGARTDEAANTAGAWENVKRRSMTTTSAA